MPNLFSVVCTRDPTSVNVAAMLKSLERVAGTAHVHFVEGASSIFAGYQTGVEALSEQLSDDDVLMFHHDDIDFIGKQTDLNLELAKLQEPGAGFVGVAGTRRFTETGQWWAPEAIEEASLPFLSGVIYHQSNQQVWKNTYGDLGPVAILDGVFMACTYRTYQKIQPFHPPESFTGEWDYYDVWACYRALQHGLTNYTLDIPMLHRSMGGPQPSPRMACESEGVCGDCARAVAVGGVIV